MLTFLTILIIPILVAAGCFIFLKGITWKEFAIQVVAAMVVAGVSLAIIYYSDTTDKETWNGWVTGKEKVWTSCEHSYSCHCHESCSGSGKNRSCSEHCDTCYEHFNDWNWVVYTSNKETIRIHRIDRQGSYEPPRWARVVIHEPTAVTHNYTSYIKASPDTLFRHQGVTGKYATRVPRYPIETYDYYRINRLVGQGLSPADPEAWNEGLSKINADLGSKKQVNMIVVLTTEPDDWYYALEEAWLGGKKNDAILVIGVDAGTGKPKWAQVMCWTTAKIFEIKLRDDVMALPTITPEATLKVMRDDVQAYYKRKPMKDFEYLASSVSPSPSEYMISTLIEVVIALGLGLVFHLYDPFGYAKGTTKYSKSFRVG